MRCYWPKRGIEENYASQRAVEIAFGELCKALIRHLQGSRHCYGIEHMPGIDLPYDGFDEDESCGDIIDLALKPPKGEMCAQAAST